MKTKKLSLENLNGALSRDEMKKIMAGSGTDCQDKGMSCSTPNKQNCCNGLVCADNTCQVKT